MVTIVSPDHKFGKRKTKNSSFSYSRTELKNLAISLAMKSCRNSFYFGRHSFPNGKCEEMKK